MLYEQGERHSGGYLLCAGLVFLFARKGDGHKLGLGILGPGEIVGVGCFLGQERHALSAQALTAVQGHYLSWEVCQQILEKPSELGTRLIPLLVYQIQWVRRQLKHVAAGSGVRERLAALLVELGRRCGRELPSGARRIDLKLSCELLGEMIDARRTTVNTVLSELRERGWIVRESGKWLIVQEEALRELAQNLF